MLRNLSHHYNNHLKTGRYYLTSLLTLIALFLGFSTAEAVQFSAMDGEITGSLDNKISVGVGYRMAGRKGNNVGVGNGGTYPSLNEDNGNLNYNKYDIFTEAAKSNHELEMSYKNLTLFARAQALYDYAIMASDTRRTSLGHEAKRAMGATVDLLDCFLSYDSEYKERGYTLRLGNHVLNWGESTFMPNGINVINPLDLAKFRTAGAELRDGLIPVQMVSADIDLSKRFTIGGFYQFQFKETKIDPMGTYFSDNDFVSPDSHYAMIAAGGTGNDLSNCTTVACAIAGGPMGESANRGSDVLGRDHGNYGFFLRYFEPMLNETEFGLFFINYTSRLPLISGYKGAAVGAPLPAAAAYIPNSYYFVEYPANQQLFGASFNTMVGTYALQGEVSYKKGHPIQVDDDEILKAVLGDATSQLGTFADDSFITGYKEKDVTQCQVTLTKVFGPLLKANDLAVAIEVGGMRVHNMEKRDVLRYEAQGTATGRGFPGPVAWGYSAVARATYNNVIGAINLLPSLAFSHDVSGTSPKPLSNFIEDRKKSTLALMATYLNWEGKVAYTHFFGAGLHNSMRDRDFLTLSAAVSF